ncbi:MAG: isopentenyl-diphosphate Delta-isomerase [Ginsengibacter sp.]
MKEELLILVDEQDNEIGTIEKWPAHQKALLHRAFSVFIFNSKGELLLQQRAYGKYHSPGLWSNTCCSHPLKGESIEESISRRLMEEMGMICDLHFQFKFIYHHTFDNGLTEHEFDHVYFGISDSTPVLNPDEVNAWRYLSMKKLEEEINQNPENFTAWLKICLPEIKLYFEKMDFEKSEI